MQTQPADQKPVDVDLKTAAKLVGIGWPALYDELRKRKLINENNIAYNRWVREGYFRTSNRQHRMGKTDMQRQYCITLVTDYGMSLIADIAAAINKDVESKKQRH